MKVEDTEAKTHTIGGTTYLLAGKKQFGSVLARYWMESDEGSIGDHLMEAVFQEGWRDEDFLEAYAWRTDMRDLVNLLKLKQAEARGRRAQEEREGSKEETAEATDVATAQVGAVD
jgi:hypothetical protein